MLKLIAWDDRPEHRLKDLWDIALILDHYFNRFDEDIYDNHSDLFGDKELDEIAAFVIGRKIKYIIGNSNDLKKRLSRILTEKQSEIVERMSSKNSKPEDIIIRIVQNLHGGIMENTEG